MKDSIYIEWAAGGREYFNLEQDPDQIQNVLGLLPVQTRKTFATKLRQVKRWAPTEASFRKPYFDLETLAHPYVLEGISEATVVTRHVKLAIRDLSNGMFWDGGQWVTGFVQVNANIKQPNGMLTVWDFPMEFGNQKPAGLVKAWVWGLDWSSNYQPPDTVVFRLGRFDSEVTLVSPVFSERFSGTANLSGAAVDGDDRPLDQVELRIRDVDTAKFWTGENFVRKSYLLPATVEDDTWRYTASLPAGTYRVSVNGLDQEGNKFDATHRLFHVDP